VIPDRALALLRQVAEGVVRPEGALAAFVEEPGADALDFATIDHHRALRQGYPEVIFAQGKTPEQVVAHLNACGVAIEEGPVTKQGARGALRSVYCRDPDGSLIEISSYDGGAA